MNEYKCAMCKGTFYGEPARRNAAGTFCTECHLEISRRVSNGQKMGRKHETFVSTNSNIDRCNFCGVELTPANRRLGKHDANICRLCETGRRWLKDCIDYSDYIVNHVNKSKTRKDNKLARIAPTVVKIEKPSETILSNDVRTSRMERLLGQIAKTLGI